MDKKETNKKERNKQTNKQRNKETKWIMQGNKKRKINR